MLAKLKETFKNFTAPSGDAEGLALKEKVLDCTSEYLLSTDWSANAELTSMISNGDVGANSEHVLGVLAKRLDNPNPRVQMLALTVSESCVKECGPAFHEQLAVSPFFVKIRRSLGDRALRRDLQVQRKMLTLLEDWSRSTPFVVFGQALTDALAAGVTLPPRDESEKAPIMDRDEYDARAQQQAQQGSLRNRFLTATGMQSRRGGGAPQDASGYQQLEGTAQRDRSGQQQQQEQHRPALQQGAANPAELQVDPSILEEMSEADRAAVLAAMHGDVQADTGVPGEPQYTETPRPPQAQPQPSDPEEIALDPRASPDEIRSDLAAAAETVALFQELLTAADADTPLAEDALVQELARRCQDLVPRLHKLLSAVTDEELLTCALQVNDSLSAAMDNYNARMQGRSPPPAVAGDAPAQSPQRSSHAPPDAPALDPPAPPPAAADTGAMQLINFDDPDPVPGSSTSAASPRDFGNGVEARTPSGSTPDGTNDPFAASADPFAASAALQETAEPSAAAPDTDAAASLNDDFEQLVVAGSTGVGSVPAPLGDVDTAAAFDADVGQVARKGASDEA